jgi:hypothetical protein
VESGVKTKQIEDQYIIENRPRGDKNQETVSVSVPSALSTPRESTEYANK